MIEVIDVSELQGAIQWPAVATSGIGGAWIRCNEGIVPDRMFRANWQAAKQAGMPRGAYVYLRCRHSADDLAAAVLNQLGDDPGELPVMIDAEELDGVDRAEFLTKLSDLVDELDINLGRMPVLYTGPAFWDNRVFPQATRDYTLLNPGENEGTCNLWVAHYGVEAPRIPFGWQDWTLWQYTDCGRVAGIKGNVDRSKFRGTAADLLLLGLDRPPVDTVRNPVAE